jgi:hypothetical protein
MDKLTAEQQKVLELVRTFEGSVAKEVLQWETDYGEHSEDYNLLGPRPRRSALIRALGDLADVGLIELTPTGIIAVDQSEHER